MLEEDDIGRALPVRALVDGTPPVDDKLGVPAPQPPLVPRSQQSVPLHISSVGRRASPPG